MNGVPTFSPSFKIKAFIITVLHEKTLSSSKNHKVARLSWKHCSVLVFVLLSNGSWFALRRAVQLSSVLILFARLIFKLLDLQLQASAKYRLDQQTGLFAVACSVCSCSCWRCSSTLVPGYLFDQKLMRSHLHTCFKWSMVSVSCSEMRKRKKKWCAI